MWNYEKRLQFPVKISKPNPTAAKIIITQFGGPYHKKIYHLRIIKGEMEGLSSPVIHDALNKRLEHGVFVCGGKGWIA
ncbi:MAG: hypothetical protein DBY25_01270 [Clostridiales bacterium]|nr:MAG: hypothetical protein DBY25_01270 [Clostridiales bacterium]